MGQYQGYEKYKDSGVEWLGEIPEHWEVMPLKRHLLQKVGAIKTGPFGSQLLSSEMDDHEVKVYNQRNVLDQNFELINNYISQEKYQSLKSFEVFTGDFLITTRGTIGRCAIAPPDYQKRILHPCLMRLQINLSTFSSHFLMYLIQDGEVILEQLKAKSNATTIEVIYSDSLKSVYLPTPPLEEQNTIAQFLDHKTSQIDALISKKEALLEKLDEKRTALISHAVTKGLDPTVPMKNSGIEWLGDIPKHWTMMPVKRFSEIYDCKHKTVSFVDDGLPVASIAQVQNFYLDLSDAKKTTKEEFLEMIEGGREPRNGDIVFSRNATVGASAIVKNELFCMGQDVCLIRPKKANTVFINYNFCAFFVKSQIDQCLLGSTFKRINVEEVKNIVVCLPSIDEQQKIAQYLDIKTAEIDQQKAKIQQAIDLLKEYRTALITNAVTGKIDVRQVPIPQP